MISFQSDVVFSFWTKASTSDSYISRVVLLGESGWCSGHQPCFLSLVQMLYVGWISVDLNLTSIREFSAGTSVSFLIKTDSRQYFEGHKLFSH